MDKMIFAVAGLGFGDEGKGKTVDYLVRRFSIRNVVRYNGGAQAAHNVVSPEGVYHCFSQFGSGTLVPGVRTLLSRYMLVNPLSVMTENEVLQSKGITDALERLLIDRLCPVITPMSVIVNRMEEIFRGNSRHGSCGQGVGQTMKDVEILGSQTLLMGDLADAKILRQKLDFLWRIKLDLAQQLAEQRPQLGRLQDYLQQLHNFDLAGLLRQYLDFSSAVRLAEEAQLLELIAKEGAIFEGAQGVLLDPGHGFWPYVTQTRTTYVNADDLILRSGFSGQVIKLGVLRGYATRHGAGPFVSESDDLRDLIPACHNGLNEWQGQFRLGWFDLLSARYALQAAGPIQGLAITNLDRLAAIKEMKVCTEYQRRGADVRILGSHFELVPGSTGAICGIKPKSENSKPSTEIAEQLLRCQPIYSRINNWSEGGGEDFSGSKYLDFLSKNLGVPIALTSFGPSARETSTLIAF